jgi:hypothetical protein
MPCEHVVPVGRLQPALAQVGIFALVVFAVLGFELRVLIGIGRCVACRVQWRL